MLKKDLNKCYKDGTLTEAEYNEWLSGMHENNKGELCGVCPNGKIYYKFEMDGDIFDQPLWQFVSKSIVPPLGVETTFPVFAKYGYTYGGICEGFQWKEDKLKEAPEIDLWQMIGIASRYWETSYKRWYNQTQSKLDSMNPNYAFNITKIEEVTDKYAVVRDEEGHLRSFNYRDCGYKLMKVEVNL